MRTRTRHRTLAPLAALLLAASAAVPAEASPAAPIHSALSTQHSSLPVPHSALSTQHSALASDDLALDQWCQDYSDALLPRVLDATPWRIAELEQRAAPEYREAVPAELTNAILGALSNILGRHVGHTDPRVDVTITRRENARVVTCRYETLARFQRGSAVVVVRLILRGDDWEVVSFNGNVVPARPAPTS